MSHVSNTPDVLLNLVRKEAKSRFPKLTLMTQIGDSRTYNDDFRFFSNLVQYIEYWEIKWLTSGAIIVQCLQVTHCWLICKLVAGTSLKDIIKPYHKANNQTTWHLQYQIQNVESTLTIRRICVFFRHGHVVWPGSMSVILAWSHWCV